MPKKIQEVEKRKRLANLEEGIRKLLSISADRETRKEIHSIHNWIKRSWESGSFQYPDKKPYRLDFFIENFSLQVSIPSHYISDIPIVIPGVFCDGEHQGFGFKNLPNAGWLVDGGANLGCYSILMALRNPESKILAIEPDPITFSFLEKNIDNNSLKDRIVAVQVALASRDEKLEFQHYHAGSRVSSRATKKIFGKRSWFMGKDLRVFCVQGHTVSKVCREKSVFPEIIKLDIEGAEDEVINEIVDDNFLPPRIVVEYHTLEKRDSVVSTLLKAGYRLLGSEEEGPTIGNLYFEKSP